MSPPQPAWMLTVVAYQEPAFLLLLSATTLAASLTLRLRRHRNLWDQGTTFLTLTGVFLVFSYLLVHILFGLPVAGIEWVSFSH